MNTYQLLIVMSGFKQDWLHVCSIRFGCGSNGQVERPPPPFWCEARAKKAFFVRALVARDKASDLDAGISWLQLHTEDWGSCPAKAELGRQNTKNYKLTTTRLKAELE